MTNLRSVSWALALVVSACAAPTTTKTEAIKSDEEVVAERALARWNAIIAGDMKKAYEFVSPAGRSVMPYEAFSTSIKQGFHKSARVEKVKCEVEACEVDLQLEYEYSGSRFKTAYHEKWVKQDGSWWYLLR